VPPGSTFVLFTPRQKRTIVALSSSGGGLFGRPATRESSGRFLFGLPLSPVIPSEKPELIEQFALSYMLKYQLLHILT
jgi:hypothetical protein